MQASLSWAITLADRTVVLPGHGASTTIGHERATNPHLRGLVGDGSRA
jgi:hydroxyacylglutathione hydrolase